MMSRTSWCRRRAALALAVSLGCASSLGAAAQQQRPAAPAPAAQPPPVAAAEVPAELEDYLIGAGDVLRLLVWKEPELTGETTVRLDGKMTVPLLGDVMAAGRSPHQLGGEIAASLRRFVEAPRVTVGVVQANSSRFFVMGQVVRPGDYALTRETTVVQALALAGGFKDFAKTDSILVIRRNAGRRQGFIPVNYKKLEAGRDLEQNITIQPGDTILVP